MIHGLGERLQEQRMLKRLSQKEVASILNISASSVSNYEHGERTPSVEALMAFAGLYHCSVDYLLGIDKSQKVMIDTSMLNDKQIALLQEFLIALSE